MPKGIVDGSESFGSGVELHGPQEAPIPVPFGIERKYGEVSPWEGLLVYRGVIFKSSFGLRGVVPCRSAEKSRKDRVKWTSPENFTALNFTVRFTPRWTELEEKGRDEEREGSRK